MTCACERPRGYEVGAINGARRWASSEVDWPKDHQRDDGSWFWSCCCGAIGEGRYEESRARAIRRGFA